MKHQSIHKHAKQLDLVKRLAKMNKNQIQSAQSVTDLENASASSKTQASIHKQLCWRP
ncbi:MULTISPECIES: hypothetical protein [Gammaproteobacteria]|nr:hypothetical protein [Acinetobacter baumannii]EHZ6731489.1 hypothetical protein [Acinetobacter baumannii]EKT8702215.1 hypothetical protein [Acinetobacter baumannii]EKT9844767.1 hypothetical protein [Acinetobacter baumannii]EKT9848549.1 hypothetical protein [Acinetobacter baumannii]EKV2134697.1 hypothetical protein [Acinetobacter baumannii]